MTPCNLSELISLYMVSNNYTLAEDTGWTSKLLPPRSRCCHVTSNPSVLGINMNHYHPPPPNELKNVKNIITNM